MREVANQAEMLRRILVCGVSSASFVLRVWPSMLPAGVLGKFPVLR